MIGRRIPPALLRLANSNESTDVRCEPVVIGCGPDRPGKGVGCPIEEREKAPLGIARDGVIIGSPLYIDDNGRPARQRANAS